MNARKMREYRQKKKVASVVIFFGFAVLFFSFFSLVDVLEKDNGIIKTYKEAKEELFKLEKVEKTLLDEDKSIKSISDVSPKLASKIDVLKAEILGMEQSHAVEKARNARFLKGIALSCVLVFGVFVSYTAVERRLYYRDMIAVGH